MAYAKELPTKEELDALMDYNQETGVLTWKERPLEMFAKASLRYHGQFGRIA